MTDSAFSAHLTHDGELYHIDACSPQSWGSLSGFLGISGSSRERALTSSQVPHQCSFVQRTHNSENVHAKESILC